MLRYFLNKCTCTYKTKPCMVKMSLNAYSSILSSLRLYNKKNNRKKLLKLHVLSWQFYSVKILQSLVLNCHYVNHSCLLKCIYRVETWTLSVPPISIMSQPHVVIRKHARNCWLEDQSKEFYLQLYKSFIFK